MTNKEIKVILENHRHWFFEDVEGWDTMRANLKDADLKGANLTLADLRGADIRGANLTGADLRGANLKGADLSGADFTGANLKGANLRGANLSGANLMWPIICPSHGAFIGWKKARSQNLDAIVIVKLYIPEDAIRCSATTNKCRCSKARCLSAYIIGDDKKSDLPIGTRIVSSYNRQFVYEIGGWIVPDSFDPDRWNECSHGIHFFMTEKEAINY